jgi:hypothetical protein
LFEKEATMARASTPARPPDIDGEVVSVEPGAEVVYDPDRSGDLAQAVQDLLTGQGILAREEVAPHTDGGHVLTVDVAGSHYRITVARV